MDIQQSQSANGSPVERDELHQLMAEVADLRAKVASLEKKARNAIQRVEKASDLYATQWSD